MTAPTRIGKWVFINEHDPGGFAAVSTAHDTGLNRVVAPKVLRLQHTIAPRFIQRFYQKTRAAVRPHHQVPRRLYPFHAEETPK